MGHLSELEAKAVAGDRSAFGSVIRNYDHDLRGVAWAIVRDPSKTDDVMQDTYEKAFMALDRFDSRSAMKTWLHSICYRTAIDYVRRESLRSHDPIVDNVSILHATDNSANAGFTKTVLAESLEMLDVDSRALLMLSVAYGYTYEEVAEITGPERGTVNSRLSRAKSKLQHLYREGE